MSYDIPKCLLTRMRDVRYRSVYPDYDNMYDYDNMHRERALDAFDINQEIIKSDSYIAYTGRTTSTPDDESPQAPTRMRAECIPVESCTESFVPPQIERIDIESQILPKDIETEAGAAPPAKRAANSSLIDLTDLSLSYPIEDEYILSIGTNDVTENRPHEHVIDIVECEDIQNSINNLDLSRVTLTRGTNKVNIEYDDEESMYWKFLDQPKNYWDFYQDELHNDYREEELEYESDTTHSSMPELIDIDSDEE